MSNSDQPLAAASDTMQWGFGDRDAARWI